MNAFRQIRLLWAVLFIGGLATLSFYPARSSFGEDRAKIILSHLPPRDSRQYKAIWALAAGGDRQILEMTNSEMWSFAASRMAAVSKAAGELGVSVTRLDQNWNRMLTPYPTMPALTAPQAELRDRTMESKAAVGGSMMKVPDAAVLEYALTKGMNDAQPEASPATLFTPLNDRFSVTARRTSLRKTAGGYIWHGVLVDSGEPVTLMWWPDGRLTGTITHAGHMFSVKPMGDGMQGVVEIEPKMLPPDHQPMSDDMKRKMELLDDPLVKRGDASLVQPTHRKNEGAAPFHETPRHLQDEAPTKQASPIIEGKETPANESAPKNADVTITLIVAYTKQAASHYDNIEKDLISLAIEEANQSFRISGVPNVHLKLVHAYMTDYAESGRHFDHLYRFMYDHDGYMDEIHGLRREYHANVAILIVHDPHGCGLSAQVAGPADKAFAVVHDECAALSYSLAHEVGHIIGARHDLAEDDSVVPFPFGHGFIDGRNKWRDIMSYDESCGGCPRIPIWSSPNVKINGETAGDAERNNAEVIRERAAIVAAFEK